MVLHWKCYNVLKEKIFEFFSSGICGKRRFLSMTLLSCNTYQNEPLISFGMYWVKETGMQITHKLQDAIYFGCLTSNFQKQSIQLSDVIVVLLIRT